jgi:hypothetical protein
MKKVLAAVIVLAAGLTAFSFYADAYDPIREKGQDKGMQTIERQANQQAEQIVENRKTSDSINKAAIELEEWNKMSREAKLKMVEQNRVERRKKTDAQWQRKSADKKLTEYEKRLKKRALSKEEKAKIANAKLAEKCSEVEKDAEE